MIYPLDSSVKPGVTAFVDSLTNSISYVAQDPESGACAVIDPVMDFDYAAGRITFDQAEKIVAFIEEGRLKLEWLIETHVHADHLSAAPYIQAKLGGKLGISREIIRVQETFGKLFNEGTEFRRNGTQFDRLFGDGDMYSIGGMKGIVMHTPGHTPACTTHVIGDAAFVGDTLFMPDVGTARADFPGGDAGVLYDSMQKILALPPQTRIFVCHDYPPAGREEMQWETTASDEKDRNIHVGGGRSRQEFVRLRNERDKTLPMPKLIIPSLQVNMRAGKLPPADESGKRFLKVPLNGL